MGKKVEQPRNGYPIIIHGPKSTKAKLRSLAKKSGKSMAEIVCAMIERSGKSKPKTKKVATQAVDTSAGAIQ